MAAAVASCTGEKVEPGYSVSTDLLKVSDLNILGATADTVLTIEANSAWTLNVTDGDEQQLGLSRKAGNGTTDVRLTPGINPSATASRVWTLLVTTDTGLSRSVSVTQAGAEVSITATPGSINAAADGDTVAVSITCNGRWTAELTGQAPGFVHFRDGQDSGTANGTIELIIDRNENTAARSGAMKLTAIDSQQRQQVATVSIRQEAMVYRLAVDVPEMTQLPSSAVTLSATVTCNSTWTATVSGADFVTLGHDGATKISGSTDATLELNIAENTGSSQRSAMLTVTMDKDNSQRFTAAITQKARTYTITLFRKRMTVPNTGGTFTLGFMAENNWRAEAETGEWLQMDKYVGTSSDQSVTVSVDANHTQNVRQDMITFTVLEGGYQAGCLVVQSATGAPAVTLLSAAQAADGTATVEAQYESDATNVGVVTECGFYYGTDASNLADTGTKVNCSVAGGESGHFSQQLTGLLPSTTYYIQAFAVNPRGTGLSEIRALDTAGTTPDEDDIRTPDTP